MTSHTRISQILSDFSQGALDCLVGTQMLAKGHDFPKVTLVVIVHVEDGLFLPDFRSGERTFQLLMQALGRAGRGEHAGRVLFQTLLGSHPLLEFVFARDFNGFAQRELNLRRLAGHPPFMRQILLEIGDKNLDKLGSMACQLRDTLLDSWKEKKFSPKEVRLAGPYPATLEKLQDVFRHQICISFAKSFKPQQILPLEKLKACKALYKNIRIDVDPLSFL